jgi:M6 family metalloprotease-like protein
VLAAQEIVQGMLELRWGDPNGGAGEPARPSRFTATLVTDDGRRIALEPGQAKRAAGDLYALANRRVAIEFAAQQKSSRLREASVIVPADRLSIAPQETKRVMAAAPVSGNTRWVTLMCKFADVPDEQKDILFFQTQYGTAPGLLGHYWSEVSYGKVTLNNSSAHGWYTLPHPRSTYITGTGDEEDANLSRLFKDCSAAADADVSFAGVQGINLMFNGNLDGSAWGGGSCAPLDGVNTCKRVTWNPPWAFSNLAPLAHEMGHGYGLPHSDNSDGDDDTYDNPWDVMSSAWNNAVRDTTYGSLPKHVNIYQRERLGWVDAARKVNIPADNRNRVQVTLDYASLATSSNAQMVVIALPDQAEPYRNVIYTLEARRPTGSYESRLAGTAVIIHELKSLGNARSMDADVPPADVSYNQGSMFKVGETWTSPDPLRTHWVTVESATATGFIVSVGPKPRVTGGTQKPRVAPSPAVAAQPPKPTAPPPLVKPVDVSGGDGRQRRPQRSER